MYICSSYCCLHVYPSLQLLLLQKQLDGLQLDRVLGTPLSADQPHNTLLLRDLRAQIEAVKGTGEQGTDHALYEVYTRSEAAKFAHLSKVLKMCVPVCVHVQCMNTIL